MTEEAFGANRVSQKGTIVQDLEAETQAWVEVPGVAVREIMIPGSHERPRTAYSGEPPEATAELAIIPMDLVELELIEPIGGPST